VVVGHPEHRRVTLFQQALARRGLPPARVVAWRDLLSGRDDLRRAAGEGARVRIESPGQDFEVEKLLLAAGAGVEETQDVGAAFMPAEEALSLPFDRGRLLCPRQWYRGFQRALGRLAEQAPPGVRWVNHPEDVAALFDKRLCHRLCAGAGVALPAALNPARSFEELLCRMEQAGCLRVFVKLACGSSAAGVVAFRTGGGRMQAVTTAEMVWQQGRLWLYNSRSIRCYERPGEIEPLIDALCREGVQVEEWLPKASIDGEGFDLRVLVVAGRAGHVVPRFGPHPMTNLHLLNRRGDPDRVRAEIPDEAWASAVAACERAAGLFARCHHVGVDVLLTPSFRRHAVLEQNAFGDLLPGALWRGLTTHDAELAALED
jgi:hypothetical protein